MKFRNYSKAGSILAACAILASVAGCEKEKGGNNVPDGPDEGLNNQIKLDEQITDIKTVLYSQEHETWTFWLSPQEGLFLIEDVEKTDDYLKAVVKNPKGTVDVANNLISLEYKDVKVTGKTAGDFAKVELQADPMFSGGRAVLNFYTLVEHKTGHKLVARYNGPAKSGIGEVGENSWQVDGKASVRIQSTVRWTKTDEFTEYYFYADEGKTEPAPKDDNGKFIRITVASDINVENIDLATADKEKVQIKCNGMNITNAAEGHLKITADGNKVKMDLRSRFDNNGIPCVFRANALMIPVKGYYATGKLNIKQGSLYEKEIDIKKVYHNATNKLGYEVAFGLKEETGEMTELMDPEARYAVTMIVSNEDVRNGKTINLNEANKRAMTFKVFDYKNFETFDFATTEVAGDWHGGEGVVKVETLGKDKVYIFVDVTMGWSKDTPDSKKGLPFVKMEWYGDITDVTNWKDITPSRPALDCFIAKAEKDTDFESSPLYKEITEVKVAKKQDVSIQGSQTISSLYEFTFECAESDPSIKSKIVFSYKEDDVNKGAIDVTTREETGYGKPSADKFLFKLEFKDMWEFWGDWNLMNSGQITNTWGYGYGPTEGTIDVSNDRDNWKIIINIKNAYNMPWGGGVSGDRQMIRLQYEGKASN